jgi:hypothetical protein
MLLYLGNFKIIPVARKSSPLDTDPDKARSLGIGREEDPKVVGFRTSSRNGCHGFAQEVMNGRINVLAFCSAVARRFAYGAGLSVGSAADDAFDCSHLDPLYFVEGIDYDGDKC